jgi:hypothetical protein
LPNIIAIVVLVFLLALAGWFISKYQKTPQTENVYAYRVSYDCNSGQNALELLKTKANIKSKDSEFGVYVSSIDDIANSENGFWMYYVNGQIGEVGADQYKCQDGDKVEWRFETLN